MDCPDCRLINPPEAMLCDCGYNFVTKKDKSEAKPALPKYIDKWRVEPELACPIPRRVVLRWGYLAAILLAVISFLGLGLAACFYGAVNADYVWSFLTLGVIALLYFGGQRERRLSRLLVIRGTATRGIIVERKWISGHKANGHWRGVIAYETPARHEINSALGEDRKVGDTLTVLYLPEAPEQAKPYKDCDYKAVASQEERST